MKKVTIALLIFFLFPVAKVKAEEYKFLNLGIIYPLSMNRSKHQAVNINLSLLQNSVGNVKGVNMCGFSAVSLGNVDGLQSSFLYSQINGDHTGASFSTLNFVNNNFTGAQLGIAANMTGRSVVGAQSSGVINFVGGNFNGYQQSAVYNIVGKTFKGAQFAGIVNAVGSDFYGLQYGLIFNFTARKLKGVQWGSVNIAAELQGLQMGYINIAQKNYGCQVGLLNIAEEQEGFPVGLINLSDDGDVQWLNYSSSFCEFITGVRFLSGRALSSLEVGSSVRNSEYDQSLTAGFHYGYRVPWKRFGFAAGIGYFHVISWIDEEDEENLYNSLAVDFSFSFDFKINTWLGLTAGFGSFVETAYEVDSEAEESDLWFLGITLF